MKNIILLFILFFPAMLLSQVDNAIDKGSGWLYFSGIPGTTPSVSSGSEAAINLNTREAYIWNRDSSEWQKWLLIDSVAYASDTLRIWQNGSATPLFAVIPSGTIDTAYLSGDTLGIVFAGDTTEVILAGLGGIYGGSGTVPASTWVEQLGSLIFDIDSLGSFTVGDIDEKSTGAKISISNTGGNDGGIIIKSGSGAGYTDATVEVNNYYLPGTTPTGEGLPSGDYMWIVSQAGIRKGQDSTGWIHIDSLLSGYTSGSGTIGTLPIWTGAGTLGNSSLTQTGQIISSSLTGALKVPSGTDAEVPVWAAGQLRYNTTQGGFQGGANGHYLPWADTDNFGTGYIPYSDGAKLTSSNQLKYVSGQFGFGLSSSAPSYGFHVNSSTIGLQATASSILELSSGLVNLNGMRLTQPTTSSFSNVPSARFRNTHAGGFGIESIATKYNYFASSGTSYAPIIISTFCTTNNSYKDGIDFRNFSSYADNTICAAQIENFSTGISWTYYRGSSGANPAYFYTAGRIKTTIIDNTYDAVDSKMQFQIVRNDTLRDDMILDSLGLTLSQYGSGNITGTPTIQSISSESNGRLIERKFAYAEMYCTDTNPDTVTFLAGSTTPDQPTDLTAGDLANFTYSAGRLTYTGAETAKFLINTSISFSFSEGSTDIEGWIYKDGAEVSKSEMHRKIGTGGDIGNAGQTCIVELATNSYIEIFFAPVSHTGDDDLIIENLNVNLIKI